MRYAILLVACLTACVTKPIETDRAADAVALKWAAPAAGYGTLVVKRDAGNFGGQCSARIQIDGEDVGELGTKEKMALHLPPGEYVLSVRRRCKAGTGTPALGASSTQVGRFISETHVLIDAGTTKTYRVARDRGGVVVMPSAY